MNFFTFLYWQESNGVLSQIILTSLEKKMCYQFDVKNYLQTRGANQLESKIKNSDGIKNNVNKEVHVNTERRLNNSASFFFF